MDRSTKTVAVHTLGVLRIVVAAWLLSLVFAASAVAGVVLPNLDPGTVDRTYHSVSSATPARIRFFNYCTYDVDIYWIDYSGNRVAYGSLGAGRYLDYPTYLTHPWLIVQAGTGGTTAQGSGKALVGYVPQTAVYDPSDYDSAEICNLLKPYISISPFRLDFGTVAVGQSSSPLDILVTQKGSLGVVITSITSSNPQEFAISSSTCGSGLPVGGSCVVSVIFTPSATGSRSGALAVQSPNLVDVPSVPLSGIGDAPPLPPTAATVEYFHAGFNHYFMTANPAEIAALDAGQFAGWTRTGEAFLVWTGPAQGLSGLCRFFSAAFAPKSSHFYTPYAQECATVRGNASWQYEGVVAYTALPAPAGDCAMGKPLYRLYNNGQGGAPNHRYTASTAIRAAMLGQGWIAEGAGPLGVIACIAGSVSGTQSLPSAIVLDSSVQSTTAQQVIFNTTFHVSDQYGNTVTSVGPADFDTTPRTSGDGKATFTYQVLAVSCAAATVPRGPYSAALVFDRSRSMADNDRDNVTLSAAQTFVANLGGSDNVALFAFPQDAGANRPETCTHYGSGFTRDAAALDATIQSLATASGNTPLYACAYTATSYTASNATNGANKAVLLFTDGEETAFTRSADDVITLARSTGVRVFPIALATASKLELGRIARETGGGIIYAADVRQLLSAYGSLGGVLSGTSRSCAATIQETIVGSRYTTTGYSERTLPLSVGGDWVPLSINLPVSWQ